MFDLLLKMVGRLGILVMIAFILTRFPFFREMVKPGELKRRQRIWQSSFGSFRIIGTYSGLTFDTASLELNKWAYGLNNGEAIANSRVVGVVLAGLLGGLRMGIGAGLIAGFPPLAYL
ncbi:hypothetical protein D1B31_19000 [Neobacillus notoginsengisoli]|uniref:Signal transduction histidine kinase 5TM receptor LytS transmembrane region domain-containing protein n=1 Tax=Neobacillus notoginsengisoli TaxID=1578198 RepID=A0A417YPX7_9BACI|nr:LytS/YhcK type 5TM receptor domain-containing protein [Neobacillus notoginsengisoli]RHW35729.1 hypothetical protein D1B31_19000 [Neobacillus notoginsengisoli]